MATAIPLACQAFPSERCARSVGCRAKSPQLYGHGHAGQRCLEGTPAPPLMQSPEVERLLRGVIDATALHRQKQAAYPTFLHIDPWPRRRGKEAEAHVTSDRDGGDRLPVDALPDTREAG